LHKVGTEHLARGIEGRHYGGDEFGEPEKLVGGEQGGGKEEDDWSSVLFIDGVAVSRSTSSSLSSPRRLLRGDVCAGSGEERRLVGEADTLPAADAHCSCLTDELGGSRSPDSTLKLDDLQT
jgi:hypothetical protein